MQTPSTISNRDMRGCHRMISEVPLDPQRVMRIQTSKVFGGYLLSTAQVHIIEGTTLAYRGGRDFSMEITRTTNRVTERAVAAQHAIALQELQALMDAANAHYAKAGALAT